MKRSWAPIQAFCRLEWAALLSRYKFFDLSRPWQVKIPNPVAPSFPGPAQISHMASTIHPVALQLHDYYAQSGLSEVGLFLVKSPVRSVFAGDTYRATALAVFCACFLLVTGAGFWAVRWKRSEIA